MNKHTNSLFDGASQEELTACIRLLALSVVQHRAADSFVPFKDSAAYLHQLQGNDPEKGDLFLAGKSTVEEALELVRTIAAERPLKADPEQRGSPSVSKLNSSGNGNSPREMERALPYAFRV
jgi:hypothetical protein